MLIGSGIERQLRDHPQIREHVGEIQSLDVDWTKSMADDDIWVYSIEGRAGTGELTVESISEDDGSEEILSANLRLSDGTQIEIDLHQSSVP